MKCNFFQVQKAVEASFEGAFKLIFSHFRALSDLFPLKDDVNLAECRLGRRALTLCQEASTLGVCKTSSSSLEIWGIFRLEG